MVLSFLMLVVGFVFLLAGAHWLTDGASSIARRLKIPTLVVGLTIVAFGTSAPELLITLFANIGDQADIAVGDVIGSSIANILLILGIAASIRPLALQKSTVWREIPISFFAIVVLWLLAGNVLSSGFMGLSRIDGIVLLLFFLFFLYYIFTLIRDRRVEIPTVTEDYSMPKAITYTILGFIGLAGGGYGVVNGAVSIATELGVSQAFIALSIVAIGTSLPELAASAVAAYKRKTDIAIGNIIGSNIFNIFWVLGINSAIHPLTFASNLFPDLAVALFATILLFALLLSDKERVLRRWHGTLFILIYVVYIISLTLRNT